MTRLTYLPIEGRAEATRLAFVVGEQDFEDRRFGFDEFQTIKKEEAPWGIFPFLTVSESAYYLPGDFFFLREAPNRSYLPSRIMCDELS